MKVNSLQDILFLKKINDFTIFFFVEIFFELFLCYLNLVFKETYVSVKHEAMTDKKRLK